MVAIDSIITFFQVSLPLFDNLYAIALQRVPYIVVEAYVKLW